MSNDNFLPAPIKHGTYTWPESLYKGSVALVPCPLIVCYRAVIEDLLIQAAAGKRQDLAKLAEHLAQVIGQPIKRETHDKRPESTTSTQVGLNSL